MAPLVSFGGRVHTTIHRRRTWNDALRMYRPPRKVSGTGCSEDSFLFLSEKKNKQTNKPTDKQTNKPAGRPSRSSSWRSLSRAKMGKEEEEKEDEEEGGEVEKCAFRRDRFTLVPKTQSDTASGGAAGTGWSAEPPSLFLFSIPFAPKKTN